ncbi:MAG TPA: HAD family phosphatase [Solirubrobacteraceae bacterium]|nr:HAD family phosphatase [Solirubrobacteraceae bacterium]
MSGFFDGLLVDFGGVLTSDIFASFADFCRNEGLEADAVRKRFSNDADARDLLAELECGRISEAQFEPRFGELLGVGRHEGLIDRLFGGMRPEEDMLAGVTAAKRAGVRTGLLSNSWGQGRYDRSRFGELFDAVVISGEVGMRKPDPAIYALACKRLDRAPERCVFVDDLPGNLKPAREIGMATVLHRDAASTLAELEGLLGVSLR